CRAKLPDITNRRRLRVSSFAIAALIVCDRLIARFGRESVFLDVDDIPAGVHFPSRIDEVLARSNAVLVAIGPAWKLIVDESGRRRLENSNDHVRVEIERSLALGIPVIPLLLGGNKEMPLAADLPASIQPLAHMNALLIRPNPDFDNDMRRLFSEL